MKVEQILRRKDTRIITVRVGESIEIAARLLRSENIGALVVKDVCRTEGNVVVGMLSERDIVRALLEHGPKVLQMSVSSLMSRTLITCSPEDSERHVLELMRKNHIRHLPVLDGHTLVGVIGLRDFVDLKLEELTEQEAAAAPAPVH